MINELNELLKQATKEKTEAMKPYNERIRSIRGAIRNLEKFERVSSEMNQVPDKTVVELPKSQEEE